MFLYLFSAKRFVYYTKRDPEQDKIPAGLYNIVSLLDFQSNYENNINCSL